MTSDDETAGVGGETRYAEGHVDDGALCPPRPGLVINLLRGPGNGRVRGGTGWDPTGTASPKTVSELRG